MTEPDKQLQQLQGCGCLLMLAGILLTLFGLFVVFAASR